VSISIRRQRKQDAQQTHVEFIAQHCHRDNESRTDSTLNLKGQVHQQLHAIKVTRFVLFNPGSARCGWGRSSRVARRLAAAWLCLVRYVQKHNDGASVGRLVELRDFGNAGDAVGADEDCILLSYMTKPTRRGWRHTLTESSDKCSNIPGSMFIRGVNCTVPIMVAFCCLPRQKARRASLSVQVDDSASTVIHHLRYETAYTSGRIFSSINGAWVKRHALRACAPGAASDNKLGACAVGWCRG